MKLDLADLAQKQRISRMQRRVALALAGLSVGSVLAGPTGGHVARGRATITQNGAQTTVQAGHNAVINWGSFNIGAGETTTFVQPSAASVVWNRITDPNPSQIFGNLHANGYVVLFNQSGFYFGPNSVVKVGGLLVSTAPVTMPGDNGGANWTYNGPPPTASIINYGRIETKSGGSLFLVAEKIENHGTLMAPDGTLGLYAGKEVLVSESPDGRGLSAKVTLPHGSIDNTGKLIADAGTIALHAQTVNNGGLIQANSMRQHNGVIELVASDSIHLGAPSSLVAKGDSSGISAGGSIVVKSAGHFSDAAGSILDVSGGAQGGNGGAAEISGKQMSTIHSRVEGTAQTGFKGGRLLIDPTDIVFGFNTGENADALYLDPNGDSSPFAGLSQITYAADRDIFIAPNLTWNLNASTGVSDPGSLLTLDAGRNIVFGDSSSIHGGEGWSINLAARGGSIYLNGGPDIESSRQIGSGALETRDGNIKLFARDNIFVGLGYVRTMGGGSIEVTAQNGDVDAGVLAGGVALPGLAYKFGRTGIGYTLDDENVGGIATGHGGNVTITAGGDIRTEAPFVGAYGAGNVTLQAGHDVVGRFILADGSGKIVAGNDFSSFGSAGSLALIKGSWSVNAARDIFLREVFNPNGALNAAGGLRLKYLYDYDPGASVLLRAGRGVRLRGSDVAHTGTLPIYAPKLEIHAGAGGIELGNDVILAPSPLGSLRLYTTDGGSLVSAPGRAFQITMSDSGSTDYTTFQEGHAAIPLHLATKEDAVVVSIAGNIENIFLNSPKKTIIDVLGDTLNFAFFGQNLGLNDATSLIVHGDIRNRGNRTVVENVTPNALVFDPLYTTDVLNLANKLVYDPDTHTLSFNGVMKESERDFLLGPNGLGPQIKQYDNLGNLRVDAKGNPIYAQVQYVSANTINALYQNSQDVPSDNALLGFQVGGPGKFIVGARNADLGITDGIRSQGPLKNPALQAISLKGADISLTLQNDLEMGASRISSFSGGKIDILALGRIDVGSQDNFTTDTTPKGIFTSSGGDVTVDAIGDIDVNGSRIATYDGGNVRVISHEGNINAGSGGLGSVLLDRLVVDPVTGKVTPYVTSIPGSGILATTLPGNQSTLGNIYIEATKGDVIANKGGVLQLSFNGIKANDSARINIKAGGDINANNSGIIGGNVDLVAGGDITGLIVAKQNIDIKSPGNVSVTALAQGGISVSAGSVSGSTIVGGSSVGVIAGSISDSALVSGSVTASGAQSGVQTGVGSSAAATVNSKVAEDADKTVAASTGKEEDGDEKKKKKAPVQLVRKTGRVTVILPEKTK